MIGSTPSSEDPSSRVEIREAASGDIPQLCGLLAGLFAQEADFSPDAERQGRALGLILDSPDSGRVYCADQGGAVVGMVTILFTISTAEGGRAAWLEDMVVRPDRRGRGIGLRLLLHAMHEAKATGCKRITLLTDATNRGAFQFYSRAGFVRSGMIPLRLSL
jgi:GNAT superfamily N-acetyltransferase